MSGLVELAAREPADVPLSAIINAMSGPQRNALLLVFDASRPKTAGELGVSGVTLHSLWDFARRYRDCSAPLMLISPDRCEYDGKRYWSLTKLGENVAIALRNPPASAEEAP